MSEGMKLLIVWITFSVMALAGIAVVFIWAVRNRQFTDQDRARRLPLDSEIPPDEPPDNSAGQ